MIDAQISEAITILRVRGLSFREIKQDPTLKQWAGDELDKDVDYYEAELEDPIKLDLMRMDRLMKSLNAKVERGDISAARAMVSILDRRSRLLGLDSPVKVRTEIQGRVNYTVNGVSPEWLTKAHDSNVSALN